MNTLLVDTWTVTVSALLLALLLDKILGEPRRFHPLVGFGWLVSRLEQGLNRGTQRKILGMIALTLAVLPFATLAALLDNALQDTILLELVITAVLVYLTIGWRSLVEHADSVRQALVNGQLLAAREAVGRMVSRDCAQLTETEIAKATSESVLENGADAIFAALFWFMLAGLPGVIVYRLANTLDAMWGYKNARFLEFGWAAARFDDLLNFIPARLTALSYTLTGDRKTAWQCWKSQGNTWKSPNAGPVMAAGAGAIRTSLGGPASYHGQRQERPLLGLPPKQCLACDAETIRAACALISRSLWLWCSILLGSVVLKVLL